MATTASSSLLSESTLDLVDLVDFKWLMAAEGRRINLTRLQADARYADACFVLALKSECEPLRHCAKRLHDCLALAETSNTD